MLSLQRSHGNQYVQRLLRSTRGDRCEQRADGVAETVMRMPEPFLSPNAAAFKPGISRGDVHVAQMRQPGAVQRQPQPAFQPKATFSAQVVPGPEGAGVKREVSDGYHHIFKGDTFIVKVKFAKMTDKEWSSLDTYENVIGPDSGWRMRIHWVTDDINAWEMTATKVGSYVLQVGTKGPGKPVVDTRAVVVVSDLQDFTLALVEAQSTLAGKFHKATRTLNEAATAFREAYGEQEKVLDSLAASEKMLDDVVFGVLFAAAGGALASNLKAMRSLTAVGAKGEPLQLLSDAWIDAAKDTAKFYVRSADRLRGGSSHPSTSGDATSPSVTDPIRSGGGMYKPAGEHPQDFLTKLSSRVAAEGEAAQAVLTKLIKDARAARDANSKADFEEDPVAVVNRGQMLDQISNELVTEKKVYLAALWKTWVRDHGWQTMPVLEAITRAAEAVGEDVKSWIPYQTSVETPRAPGRGPSRPL
jgi:hypothetical protein